MLEQDPAGNPEPIWRGIIFRQSRLGGSRAVIPQIVCPLALIPTQNSGPLWELTCPASRQNLPQNVINDLDRFHVQVLRSAPRPPDFVLRPHLVRSLLCTSSS